VTGPTVPIACVACGHGINRRAFLTAAAMAAVVAALDSCGVTGSGGLFSGSYGGPFTAKVADFSGLGTVGGVARVDGGSGAPTALYRSGALTFIALSMVCPHQGFAPLQITSSGYHCPNHGANFNETGAWIGGQATSALQLFATTYDASAATVTIARPT
jgi:Rieske Fe-S protein